MTDRERIARKIFDRGVSEGWFIPGNTVYNFCDDAEPEKDASRDLADEILKELGYTRQSEPELKVLDKIEVVLLNENLTMGGKLLKITNIVADQKQIKGE